MVGAVLRLGSTARPCGLMACYRSRLAGVTAHPSFDAGDASFFRNFRWRGGTGIPFVLAHYDVIKTDRQTEHTEKKPNPVELCEVNQIYK